MQDPETQKNLLLAIVLSVAVLLGWQVFYAGPKLKEEQDRQARIRVQQEQAKQPATPGAKTEPGKTSQPGGAAPAPSSPDTVLTRKAALEASPRVTIETPSIVGSLALKGGRIDDVVLAKYRDTVEPNSPNVVLLSPSRSPHPYYAEYGWTPAAGVSQAMPSSETLWTVEKGDKLTPSTPVTLVWDNGQGLVFRRTIAVDADFMFTVTDEVENKTAAPVSLNPYALISRHGMPKVEGFWILHEGFIGVFGGTGLHEVGYADVLKDGGTKSYKQSGGWLGFSDKYWGAALVPDQAVAYEARFSGAKGPEGSKGTKDTFQADLSTEPISVAPGAKHSFTSRLFAGAKVVSLIEAYASSLGIPRFDQIIDWGYFWFLTKPLFKLLHWLGLMFSNYGLAILATTVLVKIVFFPLANKSYESMAKMKLLQPEMEKLRERHKDDRTRMQQELMELYKSKKINPAAGCLPILLQIPVFFALYKVLFITIDMRHAPFFGWIRDLAAPDPTSLFNLFGLLPYAVPEFLHVGVWPLVMGATMWVQMQLNPQQPDPMQQQIFNWMPVLFTFLLASFAAGLVIYWAWNNVLSLIQQYAIMRKNGAEIHLWKNMGIDRALAWAGGGSQGGGTSSGSSGGAKSSGGGSASASVSSGLRHGMERLGQTMDGWKQAATQKLRQRTGGASSTSAAATGAGQGSVDASVAAASAASAAMTREQALQTLGLEANATPTEIDAAYKRHTRQNGSLNGSEKLNQARDVLRGREGA